MIDSTQRYQTGLTIAHLFPSIDGVCACGCGEILSNKKRKWASKYCQSKALEVYYLVKGDSSFIREKIFERDGGACRSCGEITNNWHADHIKPVHLGGSACGLENFATLCKDCHKEKSIAEMICYMLSHRSAISSQHASI